MPINSFFHLYDRGDGAARKLFFKKIYHAREKQPTMGLKGWKHAIFRELLCYISLWSSFLFELPSGM